MRVSRQGIFSKWGGRENGGGPKRKASGWSSHTARAARFSARTLLTAFSARWAGSQARGHSEEKQTGGRSAWETFGNTGAARAARAVQRDFQMIFFLWARA